MNQSVALNKSLAGEEFEIQQETLTCEALAKIVTVTQQEKQLHLN